MPCVLSEYHSENNLFSITFNRPEALNALSVELATDFNDAVQQIANYPEVKCILLKGNGRAFMAGGDLAEFGAVFSDNDSNSKPDSKLDTEKVPRAVLEQINPAVEWLAECNTPILAWVHGAVAGAGISIMAVSDLVIAEKNTKFLMAYDKIGVAPDCGGSVFLPRIIGEKHFARLMLLGETWTAEQALEYGLISHISEQENIEEECSRIISHIASGSATAYSYFKKLVKASRTNTVNEQLTLETELFCKATHTEEYKNGIQAFLNKGK